MVKNDHKSKVQGKLAVKEKKWLRWIPFILMEVDKNGNRWLKVKWSWKW